MHRRISGNAPRCCEQHQRDAKRRRIISAALMFLVGNSHTSAMRRLVGAALAFSAGSAPCAHPVAATARGSS
jgi:hypothetical protein